MRATLRPSAPYARGVATDYPSPRARVDLGVIRDVVGLLLLITGAAGLSVAAFAVDWRLGLATLSVAALSAGAYLGYER
jgi:hypothetical protein